MKLLIALLAVSTLACVWLLVTAIGMVCVELLSGNFYPVSVEERDFMILSRVLSQSNYISLTGPVFFPQEGDLRNERQGQSAPFIVAQARSGVWVPIVSAKQSRLPVSAFSSPALLPSSVAQL